jgi:hypothetical protein
MVTGLLMELEDRNCWTIAEAARSLRAASAISGATN